MPQRKLLIGSETIHILAIQNTDIIHLMIEWHPSELLDSDLYQAEGAKT